MRVLAISGSLRMDSHNTRLLRAAALALPPGVELELYDGLAALPQELKRRRTTAPLWPPSPMELEMATSKRASRLFRGT